MIKAALILLALSLPAAAATLPPMPTHTVLMSPKHAEQVKSLQKVASAAAAQPSLFLVWTYPPDQLAAVQFEVWHAQALTPGSPPLAHYDSIPAGFTLLSVVDASPVSVGGSPLDFFVVRAKDRVSGVYSNWNQ